MSLIDIIVPIYADLNKTQACLESVLHAGFSDLAELQLIYDCGPDTELERYLETLSARHAGVSLHKNETNLGFVKTVNKGFRLNPMRDVIILNSDTQVYNNWISRLLMVAARDEKIGTVTPFSNNAEICSFPRFCADNQIPQHVPLEWLDKQFSKQPTENLVELPTGVGFCMWIRRSVLNVVGPFDEEKFGRGYGEENDFCRRIIGFGYKNVIANNVFVYHKGGVSFGADKSKLIESAISKVEDKHPGYIKSVHEFIKSDGLRQIRAEVMNEALRSTHKPIVLVITHDLAGGTKQYLDDLMVSKEQEFETIILQPASKNSVKLTLPEWMGESYLFSLDQDYELLKNYLLDIGVNLIFLNHIKGNEHYVYRLKQDLQVEMWCILHDYYFIFGNPTLTDVCGNFLFPSLGDNEKLRSEDFLPSDIGLEDWQATVHKVLLEATKVIAPSESVKRLYNRFFPLLSIDVHLHRDHELRSDYSAVPVHPGKNRNKIAVIGALNKEKGADLLESVAELASIQYPELEFHLLGYAYRPLAKSVTTCGPYKERQLLEILHNLDPILVWYPCQWPETYSYTLSRVLEAGYPLLIPDLGALVDRTLGRPMTKIVHYPQSKERWLDEIVGCVTSLQANPTQSSVWQGQARGTTERFYSSPWVLPERGLGVVRDMDISAKALRCLSPKSVPDHRRELLLSLLFTLRQLPILRSLAACIPIHRQRQLKRLLSSKPVHDVVR